MFTARSGLIPYITQIGFVLKRLSYYCGKLFVSFKSKIGPKYIERVSSYITDNTLFLLQRNMVNTVVYCDSCMEHVTALCAPATVQFPYLETCGASKWRKTQVRVGAEYEASFCFTAPDVSE